VAECVKLMFAMYCVLSDIEAVSTEVTAPSSSSSSPLLCLESVQCVSEEADQLTGLLSSCDSDCDDSITKQRKCHSSALLKKQQKLSLASPNMFIKVCILFYISYLKLKEAVILLLASPRMFIIYYVIYLIKDNWQQ